MKLMSFADIVKIKETAISKEDIGFGSRVLLALEQQRRSKAWLGEQIGISKQAVNYLLNHSSNPKYVNEIAVALGVSPEWLLFGKGSQQVTLGQNAGIERIPILPLNNISHFIRTGDKTLSEIFTHITFSSAPTMRFATILENTSMEPLFTQGTLLIFDPEISPKNGDYVIFSSDNNILFRQYLIDGKKVYLKAVDTMYKTFEDNDITVLGVLVESRHHFK